MSGGIVSERATWAPPIGAIVSGYLLAFLNGKLAPTPVASDGEKGSGAFEAKERSPRRGQKLQDMLALLPTPTAERYGTNAGGQNPGPPRPGLDTLASKGLLPTPMASRSGMNAKLLDLIPTPTAGDSRNSRNATANRSPGSRHHSGETLCDRLLGTPTATDSNSGPNPPEDDKSRLKAQVRGPLNPSLHLWLLAWPEGASDYEPLEKEWFLSWLRSHGCG